MALIPYRKNSWLDHFSELESIQKEMNKLFDFSLMRNPFNESSLFGKQWAPAIDVYESKESILVKVDLPGMKKEDLGVTVQQDHLIIKGERKECVKGKPGDFYSVERSYGSFYRAIALPAAVDANKVDAKYEDGVLSLTLPKKEEEKNKSVSISIK